MVAFEWWISIALVPVVLGLLVITLGMVVLGIGVWRR